MVNALPIHCYYLLWLEPILSVGGATVNKPASFIVDSHVESTQQCECIIKLKIFSVKKIS